MANRDLPRAQGLYDPRFEHDACGVAFVVDMHGRRSHDIVEQGLTALCNLDHRGATGAEANTGDGAGILIQVPDAFLRGGRRLRAAARPAPTPPASRSCPRTGPTPTTAVAAIEKIVAERGPAASSAGATSRSTTRCSARMARDVDAVVPAGVHRRPTGLRRRSTSTGRAYVVRKRIEHEVGEPTATAVYFPSLSARTLVYKGMLTTPPAARVLPRPARRAGRDRARARALPVLHQHVPVVAARAPVPLHRPQRRDQHGEGQPELDAGPRGAARAATCSPATSSASSRSARPARSDTAALRRGARAAAPRRPLAAPRGADDDPRGVGEPRVDDRRRSGRSTASTRR